MKSYVPSLEKDFRPMIIELRKFKEKGTVPFAICVERQSGYKYRYDLNVMPGKDAENEEMIERVIKSILWVVGGFKIYLGYKLVCIYDNTLHIDKTLFFFP